MMRYLNMERGTRFGFIIFVFILLQTTVSGQQTQKDSDPIAKYKEGKKLFDNMFYGAAEQAFNAYLDTRDNNQELRADAEYYIAISAMELFQDNAEALLNRFTSEYPVNPKTRMANYYLGKFQYREKNYDKALVALEKVDPNDLSDNELGEYNFMIGYSYFRKKEYAKSKNFLAKVKDVPGTNMAIASYYYGNIEYMEGNYKDALYEFEKIKDDKKFKSIVPVYITQIYLLQGKYDKVIATGEAALKDKTTDKFDEIKLFVAEAYFIRKDYAKTVEYYKSYTGTLGPHQLYQLGCAQMVLEQYQDAIQSFDGLTINEDSLGQNISYNIGNACLKTGDKEKARAAFQFAAGLNFIPSIQEVSLFDDAKLSYELNFPKESIEAFKKFLKTYPESSHADEAKEILAQILVSSESPKEALDILESIQNRSSRLNEAYQRILYMYGISLVNNHQYDEALGYFSKSLGYPISRKIKALAYFWAGECRYKMSTKTTETASDEIDKALTNYKNFLAIGESQETPYYSLAFYNVGYCYFKSENYINARTYFTKYLDAEEENAKLPRYIDAVLRKADCNFALKDYSLAMDGYQQIINGHAPETDYATYQKGLILGLQNKDNEKISTLAAIDKSSPLADDAMFEIAETYKNNEKYDEAIKEYKSLNYNYPKNPYYLSAELNIGQAYINMNQDAKAIPIFKNILSVYPHSSQARQALKNIQNSYISRGLTDSLENFYAAQPNGKQMNTEQDSILYASAFSNITNGNCDAAVRSLKKYLDRYPKGFFCVDAHYYAADCEFKNKANAQAIDDYNFVIANSPNSYMELALKNCASLCYAEKNYELAYQRYKQLEEIANQKENVLLALNGQLRTGFNLNNYDKCIETGNKILNLAYADAESKHTAQFYIAKSQLALNQIDQAMPNFEAVYKNDKSEIGAESMYQVAYINFLKGQYKDATDLIYNLKDRYDIYDFWKAKAFILLADILVKTGDNFQAKSTLKSIIDNYEGDDLKKIASQKLQEIVDKESKMPSDSLKIQPKEDKPDGN